MNNFRVICVDDRNRPDGVPTSQWPKKGQFYTVTEVSKMRVQGGLLGFKLAELNIDSCFPYQYYSANRFRIPVFTGNEETEAMLEKLLEEAKKEALETVST